MRTYNLTADIIRDFCQDAIDCGELPTFMQIEDLIGRYAERTCWNVGYYIDGTRFKCSECGYNGWTKWAKDGMDRVPNYCPNCGAKVVEDEDGSGD